MKYVEEQKDKIPAEEVEKINKLISDGIKLSKIKKMWQKKSLTAVIERIEKEFQTLAQKYQATPSSPAPDTDSEIENKGWEWTVEGEVIDADKFFVILKSKKILRRNSEDSFFYSTIDG
jgi:hypothetical protein